MNLHDCINNEVTPLLLTDLVEEAKDLFKKLTYTHIPIVKNGNLMGMVSECDVQGFESNKVLSDYTYAIDSFAVSKEAHWLDVLEKFAQNEANVMPVLDKYGTYKGYYELSEVLSLFSETPFLSEPGGELVVEKGLKDYSLSEVAQIVESNNAKLLGAFISSMNEDLVQITLKVAGEGLNEIIQTFRRYSYNIVSGNEDDVLLKELQERSEYLKKYLDI